MLRLIENLYVGSEEDFYKYKEEFDIIIHACKEPFHRKLLGYATSAAPKDHPEYLIAYRDKEVFMNLVDAKSPRYIPTQLIEEIIQYIKDNIEENKILIHCNKGESRSPSIAFLYLNKYKNISLSSFREMYPPFNPGNGMFEIICQLKD